MKVRVLAPYMGGKVISNSRFWHVGIVCDGRDVMGGSMMGKGGRGVFVCIAEDTQAGF